MGTWIEAFQEMQYKLDMQRTALYLAQQYETPAEQAEGFRWIADQIEAQPYLWTQRKDERLISDGDTWYTAGCLQGWVSRLYMGGWNMTEPFRVAPPRHRAFIAQHFTAPALTVLNTLCRRKHARNFVDFNDRPDTRWWKIVEFLRWAADELDTPPPPVEPGKRSILHNYSGFAPAKGVVAEDRELAAV